MLGLSLPVWAAGRFHAAWGKGGEGRSATWDPKARHQKAQKNARKRKKNGYSPEAKKKTHLHPPPPALALNHNPLPHEQGCLYCKTEHCRAGPGTNRPPKEESVGQCVPSGSPQLLLMKRPLPSVDCLLPQCTAPTRHLQCTAPIRRPQCTAPTRRPLPPVHSAHQLTGPERT